MNVKVTLLNTVSTNTEDMIFEDVNNIEEAIEGMIQSLIMEEEEIGVSLDEWIIHSFEVLKEIKVIKMYNEIQEPIRIIKYHGLYLVEYKQLSDEDEFVTFGGTVGYNESAFDTLEEAESFTEKGLALEEKNPCIWNEMLACDELKKSKRVV